MYYVMTAKPSQRGNDDSEVLKFKDFKGPLTSNSKTFNALFHFKGLSSSWKNGEKKFQGLSRTFKAVWPPCIWSLVRWTAGDVDVPKKTPFLTQETARCHCVRFSRRSRKPFPSHSSPSPAEFHTRPTSAWKYPPQHSERNQTISNTRQKTALKFEFTLAVLTAIFPGRPTLAETRMSPLCNLLELRMMEITTTSYQLEL